MAPENALVFVADDDVDQQGDYVRWLPRGGHRVVATATSLIEAGEVIPTLGEQGVQVAIVDGNLGKGPLASSDGRDGRMIVEQIRKLYPEIKIVGATTAPEGVAGADVNIRKSEMSPARLNETVTSL